MPGSVYHPIAEQVTEWLNVVPQCQINTSTQKIADKLATIKLEENEEIISFDIVSLYTNVPVEEAIEVCTDLLYSGEHQLPPVDKETFKELLKLCTCNDLMQTHDGFYRQTDGLAMGSPRHHYWQMDGYQRLTQESKKTQSCMTGIWMTF